MGIRHPQSAGHIDYAEEDDFEDERRAEADIAGRQTDEEDDGPDFVLQTYSGACSACNRVRISVCQGAQAVHWHTRLNRMDFCLFVWKPSNIVFPAA